MLIPEKLACKVITLCIISASLVRKKSNFSITKPKITILIPVLTQERKVRSAEK